MVVPWAPVLQQLQLDFRVSSPVILATWIRGSRTFSISTLSKNINIVVRGSYKGWLKRNLIARAKNL